MEIKDLKVTYWKDGRYIIVDSETGEVIDDAQGYGYKSKVNAHKAMCYKFKGGKEKKDNDKKLFKEWVKEGTNKSILKQIKNILEMNFKEIAGEEITTKDIIKEIEEEHNINIPNYVIKSIFN